MIPWTCAIPGSFAHLTWRDRWPAMLLNAADDNPEYAQSIRALRDEVIGGPMRMLRDDECGDGGSGDDRWLWSSLADHAGAFWWSAPFLGAEAFLYRRLLSCVHHGRSRIDPFAARKHAEQQQSTLHHDDDDDLAAALHRSLWANRADLSLPSAATQRSDAPLLIDHTHAAAAALRSAARVVIVLDNVGHELAADLALMRCLQRRGCVVVLVAKPTPFFVSDATAFDVAWLSRRFNIEPPVVVAPEWMSGPLPYAAMPPRLRAFLAGFDVVILKGDLNYRRLVNDLPWSVTTVPFQHAAADFPSPMVALRTCKADTLLVDDDVTRASIERRRQQQPSLLVTGACAVIQGARLTPKT